MHAGSLAAGGRRRAEASPQISLRASWAAGGRCLAAATPSRDSLESGAQRNLQSFALCKLAQGRAAPTRFCSTKAAPALRVAASFGSPPPPA